LHWFKLYGLSFAAALLLLYLLARMLQRQSPSIFIWLRCSWRRYRLFRRAYRRIVKRQSWHVEKLDAMLQDMPLSPQKIISKSSGARLLKTSD
jgi:hypothetical protein